MALLAKIEIGSSVEQHFLIESISDKEIQLAMNKFTTLKDSDVIKGNFEDIKWYMTNETCSVGIGFDFDEIAIFKQPNIKYEDFVLMVKYYICLCFGDYTLLVYPSIVNAIKDAVIKTDCFTKKTYKLRSLQFTGVSDFLSLFHWVDEQFIVSNDCNRYKNKQRSLAEYQSYFMFEDIITSFWVNASQDEKDLFYPIYLWWKISMIIPIRVTEFSVIPKKCLENKNGKHYLTIRRSAIKGRVDFAKRYKLETDYKKYPYEITSDIAKIIEEYQSRTKLYGEAEIDSLFSDKMFVEMKTRLIKGSKFLPPYPHMRESHFTMALDYFFTEVIERQFGYFLKMKSDMDTTDIHGEKYALKIREIVRLNLGDTRHIALQNLLLNGCNLLMAKEISGHYTVDMIFHYAGNMKNLVKSKAYSLYKRSIKHENATNFVNAIDYSEFVLNINKSEKWIEVDFGKCYSKKFIEENDTQDCCDVGGECSICIYSEENIKTDESLISLENEFEEKIARVKMWVNSSKQLKDTEQIMIAAENMASAALNLEVAYMKKISKGD